MHLWNDGRIGGEKVSVEEMRKQVMNAYHGKEWEAKVKKMSDAQIIAIYWNLQKRGVV